jgi:vitamin B12 transporter
VGWDAGVEQGLAGGAASAGLTYFQNRFRNLIEGPAPTFVYGNVAEAETRGFEAEAALRPAAPWNLDLSYTRTETEDLDAGKPLLRRPTWQAGIEVGYAPLEDWRWHLTALWVGPRQDIDFSTGQRVTLNPYALAGLSTEYDVSRGLTLLLRVENVTGEDYEEVLGYGVPGRAAYAGAKAVF